MKKIINSVFFIIKNMPIYLYFNNKQHNLKYKLFFFLISISIYFFIYVLIKNFYPNFKINLFRITIWILLFNLTKSLIFIFKQIN